MGEVRTLRERDRIARRDAAAARRRSLVRRTAGPLFRKYVTVIPSVFTAAGELAAFRLLVPPAAALEALSGRAVLTLDSATEILGGFRFGRAPNEYAYFSSADDLEEVELRRLGERLPGTSFPLAWTPPGRPTLFAVIVDPPPPSMEHGGLRVVTRERLVRDLIGFYGLRADLLSEVERKLCAESLPLRSPEPGPGS
jgi:hypothetical protein